MKKIILVSIYILFCFFGFAQKKDSISNPLEQLFQDSFDSTISLHSYSDLKDRGEYFFIGKKNDTIYYYRYYKPIKQSPKLQFGPKNSKIYYSYYGYMHKSEHLYNPKLEFDDKFFYVFSEHSVGSLWESIQKINLWNMVDEYDSKLIKSRNIIMDGMEYDFKLITRNEVIKLHYISPEDYPINDSNKVRNEINHIIDFIHQFYNNHKVEFTINQ